MRGGSEHGRSSSVHVPACGDIIMVKLKAHAHAARTLSCVGAMGDGWGTRYLRDLRDL